MRYKFLVLIIFSMVSAQSLFNRFLGADSFSGSARSTAMGKTHLLNSTGSNNVRFNPAILSARSNKIGVDFQVNRFASFERWSMPMRDSFDEVLVYGDYVSNEFSKFLVSGGATIFQIMNFGMGFSHYPLTHFTYAYSEEVRTGTSFVPNTTRDPNVGYHNFSISGSVPTSAIGAGITLNLFGGFKTSVGSSIHITHSFTLNEHIGIDTLYSDVTNLSTYSDIDNTNQIDSDMFISASAQVNLSASSVAGFFYESQLQLKTNNYNVSIDSTNGLFQYWDSNVYTPLGLNYLKPQIIGFSYGNTSSDEQPLSISFEIDQVSYNNYINFDDIYLWKFGFEYLTQLDTPVRGGLVYSTSPVNSLPSSTMFTFGSGKRIENVIIDISGTYQLYTYKYPDLFVVENDIRPDYYDTIRDSQLNLFLAVSYSF